MVVIPATAVDAGRSTRAGGRIHALIIDRQPLFVDALASLLRLSELNARVTTASRSDAGLDMARADDMDVVFCELRAEPMSGIEVARVLAAEQRPTPVILLGGDGDEPQLTSALGTSAAGLFTKNAGLDEFLDGVRAVLAGHRALGSALLARMVDRLSQPPPYESQRTANQLSPTELEILSMIGRAQSIPSIAASRGISHKTVRNHLAKIYRKLELHGRTEAMLWAARMGLTGI